MADPLCLAIDTMGGDFGPRITVPSTLNILRQSPHMHVVLLGDAQQIQDEIDRVDHVDTDRLRIQHCTQSVSMNEKPSSAIRHQRDSSMWQALQLVADGQAQACVSAGNTGALMAMSLFQLRTLPGISRPAICTKVPTGSGYTYLLDLGANLECSAQQLYQFGLMASLVASTIEDNPSPTVGLLNIGVEEIKGRQEILDAAELFKADHDIQYIGFVEGDSLFQGAADIVVCDGFSGNVALKTGEGVAKMIQGSLKQALSENFFATLGALLARPALKRLQQQMDPAQYNGASLLGLRGVVVKSHGGATETGFACAVSVAAHEALRDLPSLIESRLSQKSNQQEVSDDE
ncbi:MAG: phosphate acyltransferase PlsX [Porticoccus sp.]